MLMKIFARVFLFFHLFSFPLFSQIKYYNADMFPLLGKISEGTETRYERLPSYLKNQSRAAVWNLGKNTAGLAVRFKSNSTSVAVKWEVLNDLYMNHMAAVGIKGLDLYAWTEGKWMFVKSARPTGKTNREVIIENMKPEAREYMLFLPLYDGITSLFIGIDSLKTISQPALPYPNTSKPIIAYGTSITQGGCASRPGMAYTNILTRQLNREFINLGFSGNGKLDIEIAELIAQRKDASLIILDFAANNTSKQIEDNTLPFIEVIRRVNPKTPILLIEHSIYPYSLFDEAKREELKMKNAALKACYDTLKKKGDKKIYYLNAENLIGEDNEATVDGGHFTDLGFFRFSEVLKKKIKRIL